jgi:ATP-dependent DNA ligase
MATSEPAERPRRSWRDLVCQWKPRQAKTGLGLRFDEHLEGDGPTVFAHACKVGLEGIVSKRKDSMYRSGRSPDWLKMKNPVAPAVKREAEEDWRHRR